MAKITSIIQYVLLAISVVTMVPVALYGESGIDYALIWAGVLLGLAVVLMLGLSAYNLVKNPQSAMRSLVGLGVVAVVLAISYFLSSTEPVVTPVLTEDNPVVLTITDMGLYTTYIAMGAAILITVLGEVRNSLK